MVHENGTMIIREIDYEKWTEAHNNLSTFNARALNIITCAISEDEFKRIIICETVRQAWDILEMTHEGTSVVKRFKLLTTQYENIKMEENKIFTEIYPKLKDIANSRWGLGDKLLEGSISTNILRSLPERFIPKVTNNQVVTDLDTMKVNELIGSLLTYDLQFTAPKKKSIALKSSTSKKNHRKTNLKSKIQEESNFESEDEKDMASLSKNSYILGIIKEKI